VNKKGELLMMEYLITFFKTLDRLTKRQQFGVSHAIAFDKESLCILVGMGDVRVKIPVKDLDPNPAKAAELVVAKWKSMPSDELNKSIEEVR
jgi:hypothetical protein